jgi:putative spermidine/putrescine transport system substrate-binding protein
MKIRKTRRTRYRLLAMLSVVVLVAAACGGDSDSTDEGRGGTDESVVSSIGDTEGALSLIAWVGYVEDGTTEGYEAYDWVTPFEDQTGCKVTVKYADSSDEMFNLMTQQAGSFDGVSASGDSSNRLIASDAVAAVDPSLFPDFADVIAPLQPETGTNNSQYVVDGQVYGVPYMYGPNFLMYNTDVVKPAPTSWDVVFETELDGAANPYSGKITAYDFPIYIADAALYLKTHQPDLGITDPYELTSEQLDAAVELLKQQSGMIDKYWAAYTTEIDGFVDSSMVAGTAWPINLSLSELDAPVDAAEPSEGMTGWADTWMLSTSAPHPNCMLEWMKWTMTADVQAEVADYYGAATSNEQACDVLRKRLDKAYGKGSAALVDTVRYGYCGDAEFLDSLALWKTPQADCGDDRGTTCQDYSIWQQKWTEVRGA